MISNVDKKVPREYQISIPLSIGSFEIKISKNHELMTSLTYHQNKPISRFPHKLGEPR